MPDKDTLLASFNEGNQDAWQQIFDDLYPSVFNLCYQHTRNKQQAEDIAVESFMKCHHKTFKDLQHIKAFVIIVAGNACKSFVRKQRTGKERLKELAEPVTDYSTAEDLIKAAEAFHLLAGKAAALLDTLPPQRQAVLRMFYLEGMPVAFIAEKLGLTKRTVYNHLFEGLKALALMMGIERKKKRKPPDNDQPPGSPS